MQLQLFAFLLSALIPPSTDGVRYVVDKQGMAGLRQGAGVNSSNPKSHKRITPELDNYMAGRLKIDLDATRTALERFNEWPNISKDIRIRANKPKKVAFLFLLMDLVDQEPLWNVFFAGVPPNKYSIYTHRAQPKSIEVPLKKLDPINVPQVQTSWCALSGVMVAIFAEALADSANAQFVLLSQNTIPLKPFSYVYSHLMRSSSTSKICYASKAQHRDPKEQIIQDELESQCHFKDHWNFENQNVRKHHQWLVLSRIHAYQFVKHAEPALHVFNVAWRDTSARSDGTWWDGCSDEAVVSLALLLAKANGNRTRIPETTVDADLYSIGVEQACLQWVRWRNCFAGSRLSLSESYMSNLSKVIGGGALWHIFSPSDQAGRSEFSKTSQTLLNGFPHFFGPPENPPTVDLPYLSNLVTQEGYMFGRKFNEGVDVAWSEEDEEVMSAVLNEVIPGEDFENRRSKLSTVLPKLWNLVKDTASNNYVENNVWSRNEVSGSPS